MLKNYLIVAWRSLKKHKVFTLINLIGLSVSMSVCLLLILLVLDHLSYDEFHPKKDNIHRILTYRNGSSHMFSGYASSPARFKEALDGQYAGIEAVTCLNRGFRGELRSAHKVLDGKGYFADEDFFRIFGFRLKSGNEATALLDPYQVVLSEEFAGKLFPNTDPIGQLVEFGDKSSYMVSGIVAPPAGKSHIQFDMLGSFSTLASLQENGSNWSNYNSWENVWMNHNYLLLSDQVKIEELEATITGIGVEQIDLEENNPGYHFKLQALEDVTPGLLLSNELSFTLPLFAIGFFLFLGLIVIITATINYTNLSIAKSLSRAREVGIRKVNGAMRKQIIMQFLVESVLLAVLSLALAVLMHRYLMAEFNSLWIMSQIGINLTEGYTAYVFFFLFSITLGLVTGIGPALYLSKFDVVTSLKGSLTKGPKRKNRWYTFSSKKLLMGIQFSLSVFLIVTIFLLKDQANYMVRANYGFNEENVFYVELQSHDPEILRNEFEKYPGTDETSLVSHHPAVGRSYGADIRLKPDDEPMNVYHFAVDKNYLSLMELNLLAGENFPKELSEQNETMVIVNEKAALALGFEQKEAIVGETIILDDRARLKVIGLVADYHYEPLMKSIDPLLLRYRPAEFEYLYLKLSGTDYDQSMKELEAIWSAFDPARDFKAGFLDQEMDLFYQFIFDISNILTLIAILAIVITCLGLLGMVSFAMKKRVKEIGIRKVLGADLRNLIWLLSKEFTVMLGIAIFIAGPAAILANSLWINLMAHRAGITVSNTLPGILIVVGLSFLVIVSQTWKTSRSNPVDSLRSE